MSNRSQSIAVISGLFIWLTHPTVGLTDEALQSRLERTFSQTIRPFIKQYCLDCHGPEKPKAKFNIGVFVEFEDIVQGYEKWDRVLEMLQEGEMPPEEADAHPSEASVSEVVEWIQKVRKYESVRNAGDPGLVVAHRLSNAEYNYTIRDLTGVDIQPTREFPVDPANQAGFDNSGESLRLSPGLLTKYIQAARKVSEHLVLKPNGLDWSQHPVVTDTDRDKYAVLRIIEFYRKQPTDLADYFYAAWQYLHSSEDRSIAIVAAETELSSKYLELIWKVLNSPAEPVGPISRIQEMWRALPSMHKSDEVQEGCERIRNYIRTIRSQLEPKVENLEARGIHRGSQPFVMWKNRQYSANRRRYNLSAIMTQSQIDVKLETVRISAEKTGGKKRNSRKHPEKFEAPHPDLILPEDPKTHAVYHRALARFTNIFPDTFYISERGRDYLGVTREKQEKGRFLSAGFHSMMGYYRDDRPLYDLILNEADQYKLDVLWDELDFITFAPKRQYQGFVWFERTDSRYMTDEDFDFARAEDKEVTSEAMISRLANVYIQKAERIGAAEIPLQAIKDYFDGMNERIRWLEAAGVNAELGHLRDILTIALRAYRRPLADQEQEELLAFYYSMREDMGLSHEQALRDTVTSILIAPSLLYRMDLAAVHDDISPLSDYDLASRLSYFLWSSMPDDELLSFAAAGTLRNPEVLMKQAGRMIQDVRIRALAVEFGANWLDFRRFEKHNAVDREHFPQFDNALRQAMFEEPIQFLMDVIQNDRSLRDLLYGKHTFVNRTLAEYYGFPSDQLNDSKWVRFDNADAFGRGGLLPMAAFLTMNSPGLRTSPVKRGYWVARRVLGEAIPPPPPDVPEIPSDESKFGDLTLPELLARHREHESCAGCHNRFDSLGLVFENYGPIGERRSLDLGNRPVSIEVTFPDGTTGSGLQGLQNYLHANRESEFDENLCRKLLAFALGRSLILSDDLLVEEMLVKLKEADYRFSVLVESIVKSRQFLTKRRKKTMNQN